MRQDMHQIVHDHLRHCRGIPLKPGRAPREVDDLPTRESMRRPYLKAHGRSMKESNEKFGPLYRYLLKQVGRSWASVYSELRTRFDGRSPTTYRPLEKIRSWVATADLFVEDGVVLEASQWKLPAPPTGLYVHPESGILCSAGQLRYWQVPRRLRREDVRAARKAARLRQLQKLDGRWYFIDYAPVTYPRTVCVWLAREDGTLYMSEYEDPDTVCRDILTGREFTKQFIALHQTHTLYAKAKRQLSRRELERHGLL